MDHNSTADATLPSTVDDITADCHRRVLHVAPDYQRTSTCPYRFRILVLGTVPSFSSPERETYLIKRPFAVDGVWEVVVNQ
jgi:hypothetical protein